MIPSCFSLFGSLELDDDASHCDHSLGCGPVRSSLRKTRLHDRVQVQRWWCIQCIEYPSDVFLDST